MILSEFSLALYLALAILGGFAIGLWVERLFVWYPFGLKPLTGRESLLGKKALVIKVKPSYIEVRLNAQIWKARVIGQIKPVNGDEVVVRDVVSNTLLVDLPGKHEGERRFLKAAS